MINKISELIQKDKRSIYRLGIDARIDQGLLYRIVNDKTKNGIRLDTAFRLADALGVDINEFREEQDQ